MLRSSCCVLLVTWLTLTGSIAQSLQSLKLKAGVNSTTITGGSDHQFRVGYYIGVAKEIPLSRLVSFQPEIYYSLQGARLDHDNQPDSYRFHYVQMPLFFNFSLGERGGIVLGPQIGVLSRAKLKNTRDQFYIVTPFMYPFDVQVGGEPYVTFGRLTVDLRTSLGVTAVNRRDEQWRSFGLQFGAAWSIAKQTDNE